jgi:hypothetical protein
MKLNMLHVAFFTPQNEDGDMGLPILYTGGCGVGKTRNLIRFARAYQIPFEGVAVGARGEGAFGCTPCPTTNGDGQLVLVYPRPDWTCEFVKRGVGLVLLDEQSTAQDLVQHAIMGMLSERTIGSYKFPKGVRFVGAMNPPELVRGYTMQPTVANRVLHLKWETPNIDAWGAHMMHLFDPTPPDKRSVEEEEKRIMEVFPQFYAQAIGLFFGFLKTHPQFHEKPYPVDDPRSSGPFPTLRTNDYAVRILAGAWAHNHLWSDSDDEFRRPLTTTDIEEMVTAAIGQEAATALFTYAEQADLASPTDYLDGNVSYSHSPARLDKTFAVLQSTVTFLMGDTSPARAKRAVWVWSLLKQVGATYLDVVLAFSAPLAKAGLNRGQEAADVMRLVAPAVSQTVKR